MDKRARIYIYKGAHRWQAVLKIGELAIDSSPNWESIQRVEGDTAIESLNNLLPFIANSIAWHGINEIEICRYRPE